MVESGDTEGPAQRHAQRHGHVTQRLHIQVSEGLLHGVQGFNQAALLQALTPHGGIDQLPTLVLIGWSWLGNV